MVQLTRVGLRPGIGGGAGAAPGPVIPGVNYYVSSAGIDTNDGLSPATPWLTVGKVNSSTFNPGDTISFRGGDNFTDATLTPPNSGSSGSPITFNSYGTGQATITRGTNSNGVLVDDKSYIVIDNFIITGPGEGSGSASGYGVLAQSVVGATVTDVTISNCTVSGFANSGVRGNATGTSRFHNFTVNTVTSSANTYGSINNTAGIILTGWSTYNSDYAFQNHLITNCRALNNPGHANDGTVNNWTGSGIFTRGCENGVVEDCFAYNNGEDANDTSGPCANWFASCRGCVVRDCESSFQHGNGADGGGFDVSGGNVNCIVERNYAHDCNGWGVQAVSFPLASGASTGNIIRNNMLIGNANGGIRLNSSDGQNCSGQVYGNTVICSGSAVQATSAVLSLEKGTGTFDYTVANNIFQITSGSIQYVYSTAGMDGPIVGNNYFGRSSFSVGWNSSTYTTLADWQTATGKEKIGGSSVATQVDPVYIGASPPRLSGSTMNMFMDAMILDNSSTLLGAAVDLTSNYGIAAAADWFGNTSTGWTAGICSRKSAVKQVIYTASATTTVPADFVSIYKAECIGAGGSVAASVARRGAGGGAYSSGAPTLTASASLQVVIGAASAGADGGDTAFNASSLANAVSNGPTVSVGAQGGKAATTGPAAAGIGGQASAGLGGIATFSGGTGGESARSGGGSAASGAGAGRNGGTDGGNSTCGGGGGQGGGTVGANGAAGTGARGGSGLDTIGGAGGNPNGTNGSRGGGGGGAGTSGTGGRGSDAFEWIVGGVSYGPGGGAGGCYTGTAHRGGTYGGGAGGQSATGGGALGAAGVARLLYHTSANV